MTMRLLVRLGSGVGVAFAAHAVAAGPAGAANPGPPDAQLGVVTAMSVSPGPPDAELPPGLAGAIGVLAAVPAVQRPPNPCMAPGFGIMTTQCDVLTAI